MPSGIVERSLTVVGSVGFDDHHLDDALARLASDPCRYRQVVTHRLPLAEVPDFLSGGGLREAVKVAIRCSS